MNLLNSSPAVLFSGLVTLVISLTVHEFAHAWTAVRFGDDTPRFAGRLTLNPLKHLDPIGSIMLIFAGFGWAKPVPVNPYVLKRHSPAALMFVALAGPLSNFLLAVLAAIPLRFGLLPVQIYASQYFPTMHEFLLYFIFTNLGLMLFNLLPIPPLDGEKILSFLLPGELGRFYEQIRPYGPLMLLMVLLIGPMIGFNILDMLLSPIMYTIGRFLLGG
ncbi:MAG TPA: site-2 protease family protein [Anaerolineae bacterium]|nr:site-2 protease family protein [Anaerolineae bacterium]